MTWCWLYHEHPDAVFPIFVVIITAFIGDVHYRQQAAPMTSEAS